MRLPNLLPLALVTAALASSPVLASDCAPARAVKVPFRPRAWSPPPAWIVGRPASGMVEGDPALDPDRRVLSRTQALSGIVVEVRPDGSRRAVLGGAIRAWSVASVGENGRLELDCVSSEAAAQARVRTAGAHGGN